MCFVLGFFWSKSASHTRDIEHIQEYIQKIKKPNDVKCLYKAKYMVALLLLLGKVTLVSKTSLEINQSGKAATDSGLKRFIWVR